MEVKCDCGSVRGWFGLVWVIGRTKKVRRQSPSRAVYGCDLNNEGQAPPSSLKFKLTGHRQLELRVRLRLFRPTVEREGEHGHVPDARVSKVQRADSGLGVRGCQVTLHRGSAGLI